VRITREKSLPAGERDPQDDLRRDTLNTRQLLRADAIAIGYRRSLSSARQFCLIAGDARRHQFVI
jgi:hypothetical protein